MPTLPLPGALLPSSSEKGLADGDPFAGIDAWCKGLLLGRSISNPRQKGSFFFFVKKAVLCILESVVCLTFSFFVASKPSMVIMGCFVFFGNCIYTVPALPLRISVKA